MDEDDLLDLIGDLLEAGDLLHQRLSERTATMKGYLWQRHAARARKVLEDAEADQEEEDAATKAVMDRVRKALAEKKGDAGGR